MVKVLTIKEPFATLIMQGIKTIETRSFKTNYRGELYIQASLAHQKRTFPEPLNSFINTLQMHYGKIICKVNLVDCIYMDEEFIAKIKKNKKEYSVGHYEVGRYAWILKDVKIIKSIPVKGKLGIWNYDLNEG